MAAVIMAATMALAIAPMMMANEANAKIECKNKGGQTVQGNCQGDDHKNRNPAGFAPPGQN